MANILSGLIPKQPRKQDVIQADLELGAYKDEQKALSQTAVIEESVERRVREEMEKVKKDLAQATNLSPFDHFNVMSPESTGDTFPAAGMGLTYSTMAMMARVPVIHAVLMTRVYQVMEFTQRQRHKQMTGYRVVMRDHARAPSTKALKRMAEIEAWFETCGDPFQQEDPSFSTLTQKLMYDSLRFDQATAEILLDKYGRPAAILPVDAKTIRRAQLSNKEIDKLQRDIRKGHYIQKLDTGRKCAEWDSDHFMFGIRRHVTDNETRGYGFPELEIMARIVNYLLQAEFYNAANFTNGVNAAGLLIFKTAMDRGQFQQLDERMRQSLAGASNAHRMAFMQLAPEGGESAQHIPFNQNNRDMEFGSWVGWLLKIACSLYSMDSSEVNFVYGAENQKQSMNQEDPSERILQSKERGLKPLLRSYAGWLNRAITWRLDEDFSLEFVGLDSRSPLVQSQLDTQAQNWTPTNELRARQDLPPLKHWVYDLPANPVTLSIIAQEKAAATQQAHEQQMGAMQQQQDVQGAPTGPGGEDQPQAGDPPEQLPDDYSQSPEALIDTLYGAGAQTDMGDINFKSVADTDAKRRVLPVGVEHDQVMKSLLHVPAFTFSAED